MLEVVSTVAIVLSIVVTISGGLIWLIRLQARIATHETLCGERYERIFKAVERLEEKMDSSPIAGRVQEVFWAIETLRHEVKALRELRK